MYVSPTHKICLTHLALHHRQCEDSVEIKICNDVANSADMTAQKHVVLPYQFRPRLTLHPWRWGSTVLLFAKRPVLFCGWPLCCSTHFRTWPSSYSTSSITSNLCHSSTSVWLKRRPALLHKHQQACHFFGALLVGSNHCCCFEDVLTLFVLCLAWFIFWQTVSMTLPRF